jgi:hypothetical protein
MYVQLSGHVIGGCGCGVNLRVSICVSFTTTFPKFRQTERQLIHLLQFTWNVNKMYNSVVKYALVAWHFMVTFDTAFETWILSLNEVPRTAHQKPTGL